MTSTGIKSTTGSKALAWCLLLAALLAWVLAYAAGPAHAATTFTVTSTSDFNDGACEEISCSLREAINAANANPGKDVIEFNIARAGVQSIRPSEELPAITEAVTIDGYSQFASSPNTRPVGNDARLLIELDGVNAGNLSDGLRIEADGVTVRGLVIQRFGNAGIAILGDANRVEGNFIGTDPTGRSDEGNDDDGVNVLGSNNVVGGTTPAARNLISGNEGAGVNDFGTRPFGAADGNKVLNNYVGTDKFGTGALGNGFAGVFMIDASRNVVGGVKAEANIIAFNAQDGVGIAAFDGAVTDAPRNNAIRSNSIHSNGDLGIDLGADGPTVNDLDTGENNLQNKPAITSAVTSGNTTTVQGRLNSAPNQRFLIESFSNPAGNEGRILLGEKLVTTNANGGAAFTFTPSKAVAAGQFVTATATDQGRNTSEFSGPRVVVAQ